MIFSILEGLIKLNIGLLLCQFNIIVLVFVSLLLAATNNKAKMGR